MEKIHCLKISPMFYQPVIDGTKTFEIRKNDRDFKVKDLIILREWTEGKYTGRQIGIYVSYVFEGGIGLADGYCVLGFRDKLLCEGLNVDKYELKAGAN